MDTGSLLQELGRHARLSTAVLPFLIALALRIWAGKGRATGWFLTVAFIWFIANMLLTPYSLGLRQDVRNLRRLLP